MVMSKDKPSDRPSGVRARGRGRERKQYLIRVNEAIVGEFERQARMFGGITQFVNALVNNHLLGINPVTPRELSCHLCGRPHNSFAKSDGVEHAPPVEVVVCPVCRRPTCDFHMVAGTHEDAAGRYRCLECADFMTRYAHRLGKNPEEAAQAAVVAAAKAAEAEPGKPLSEADAALLRGTVLAGTPLKLPNAAIASFKAALRGRHEQYKRTVGRRLAAAASDAESAPAIPTSPAQKKRNGK
jgi:hypothetical protein